MKTILYNPIFINPQAYYVFPNLNGQLVEQKDATIEPAKYSGIIEVKIIANGDIHKIKQFKNTDNIDFTEFSESWVRINQYTLEGNIVLGEWKIGNIEGKPSLDPSIKQSLVGVWIVDGKSNTDSDRDIIKNLVDPDNPFVISNAAYTEGSGYADKDSSYYGAFVTDGVNDMIVSQNPVEEMGITDEFTVVSMIHHISGRYGISSPLTNYIRVENNIFIRNSVSDIGKTGIYGYTCSNIKNLSSSNSIVINNILGDKNDYIIDLRPGDILAGKFSVQGCINDDNNIVEMSGVAWYWTFIAKRVLTTDEINQVIAYYNLDKYVKPDIYYNVKKQGLTNDTPDEDWYLKDFSGNGRDMTLYNYARTPESGINEEGGLQSDGVDDYGQFVGDLRLKDYTVVIDRAYPIVSTPQFTATSDAAGENANTPFLIEHRSVNANESTYSYLANTAISINKEREICYQSTYQYKDTVINKGSSTSLGTGLTIARYGINNGYSALVLYSFMLFHYSMSKFLIERQLKKHKLGTLYPGMVEFRSTINNNKINVKDVERRDN